MNLLMRFYDPLQGTVALDGYDLRELNVCKLRDSIGVVSQEPTLFDGTLEENVLLGNEHASREDVIRCCKMVSRKKREVIEKEGLQANAYDFIQKLPEGLYTRVGERGIQLSGEFSRLHRLIDSFDCRRAETTCAIHALLLHSSLLCLGIAITRALVRNPAILLLDEATSVRSFLLSSHFLPIDCRHWTRRAKCWCSRRWTK